MEFAQSNRSFDGLQKLSMTLMVVLTLITFVGANLHAVLWQSSDWLVSTVLPAVVVDLTNDERVELAQTPLRRNATLDAAAKLKAQDMAKNEYFAHFSPKGISPWHWFDKAGYVYSHAGENLAIHFTDSDEVVDAWMKSPTHRENIVNGLYTEIGVGTAKGTFEGYDTVYVVQLFATPGVSPLTAAQTPPVLPEVAVEADIPSMPVVTPPPAPIAVEVPVQVAAAEVVLESVPVATSPVSIREEVLPATTNRVSLPVPVAAVESVAAVPAEVVPVLLSPEEVVIIESPIISTSSGLAVASITTDNPSHAGATIASIATKPSALLQLVYMVLGLMVLVLLTISAILEARRMHYVQVVYSLTLLVMMGGLWFVHSLLTTGAVIV